MSQFNNGSENSLPSSSVHHPIWLYHHHHLHRSSPSFPRFIVVKSSISNSLQTEGYKGPKSKRNLIADFVSNNDDFTRSLPIYVGGFSLLAILFYRAVSGIAPVADASSSQSRADLLALGLAVTNILTGLVWLSIHPKSISKVDPEGLWNVAGFLLTSLILLFRS